MGGMAHTTAAIRPRSVQPSRARFRRGGARGSPSWSAPTDRGMPRKRGGLRAVLDCAHPWKRRAWTKKRPLTAESGIVQQVGPRGLAKQGADADYPREIAKAIIRQADTILGPFRPANFGAN